MIDSLISLQRSYDQKISLTSNEVKLTGDDLLIHLLNSNLTFEPSDPSAWKSLYNRIITVEKKDKLNDSSSRIYKINLECLFKSSYTLRLMLDSIDMVCAEKELNHKNAKHDLMELAFAKPSMQAARPKESIESDEEIQDFNAFTKRTREAIISVELSDETKNKILLMEKKLSLARDEENKFKEGLSKTRRDYITSFVNETFKDAVLSQNFLLAEDLIHSINQNKIYKKEKYEYACAHSADSANLFASYCQELIRNYAKMPEKSIDDAKQRLKELNKLFNLLKRVNKHNSSTFDNPTHHAAKDLLKECFFSETIDSRLILFMIKLGLISSKHDYFDSLLNEALLHHMKNKRNDLARALLNIIQSN